MTNKYQTPKNNETTRNSLHRMYLKNRRKEIFLSPFDVAMKLYVTESYYVQIENGKKGKRLPVSLLINLAKILNYDLKEIIELEKAYIETHYKGMLID